MEVTSGCPRGSAAALGVTAADNSETVGAAAAAACSLVAVGVEVRASSARSRSRTPSGPAPPTPCADFGTWACAL